MQVMLKSLIRMDVMSTLVAQKLKYDDLCVTGCYEEYSNSLIRMDNIWVLLLQYNDSYVIG